jgi:hypothetical protein
MPSSHPRSHRDALVMLRKAVVGPKHLHRDDSDNVPITAGATYEGLQAYLQELQASLTAVRVLVI